jgi:hypothetical protein
VKKRLREEDMRATLQDVTKMRWRPMSSSSVRCSQCDEVPAARYCNECERLLCADCFSDLHRSHTFRSHTFQTLPGTLVQNVTSHFEWPQLRRPVAGVPTPDAYREAIQAMAFQVQ